MRRKETKPGAPIEPPVGPDIEAWIDRVLTEDIGSGDVTSDALVPAEASAAARIVAREPCVIAGLPIASRIFERLDRRTQIEPYFADGDSVLGGNDLLRLTGRARSLLTAERTALNVFQRLCGIATLTRRFVDRAAGRVEIRDTRKTTPGLRRLEKYAVRCGGGVNHRAGLYDRFLIKDNHRVFWARSAQASLALAVQEARAHRPDLEVVIEVETEGELEEALGGRPDWVLLDNMEPNQLRRCVALCAGRARLEASGCVTLDRLDAIADTGVDAVSVGALTHSAPAIDLSLEFEQAGTP